MDATLYYAFMDESGTVGATGTRFLVVAITATTDPQRLDKIARRAFHRALKRMKTKIADEIKAAKLGEVGNLRLLAEVAEMDVAIMATIADQSVIQKFPEDAEEIYRQAAARTIRRLAEDFPRLELSIDKRYTNPHLRDLLEKTIRDELENLPRQNVMIRQESSHEHKELQVADAVVWAFFQKYERNDSRFYDVIASKVVAEEVIAHRKWE
jgi:mannitol-1-phosphate/altronate dehydrogenase